MLARPMKFEQNETRRRSNKFYVKGWKLRAERKKLYANGSKIRAEVDKIWAEGDNLRAEADKIWTEAILEYYGNIKMEWKNYCFEKDDYECHLETGEVFCP